ncbi:tol-pal system protein YbgF [Marinobacter orientalis]|uniref:Cell division coordinator CpoB n=1 Tax=Marinobacter orientalis TaxID=1928859 RepID=A0A7Y0RCS2_9GAMM|nr:tol-pal system protein YbgF [Marinobacter orientalis]NMT63853.1 tol-pal system protein YbgF [Marinobacter orientalis]TGX49955.1 tol-pal system protein YbgF [Marinobacter orientalis]
MRHLLMAAVLLPLAFGPAGSALAQSVSPAFQDNSSEAGRKAGNSQANAELFYMIQQLQGEIRRLQGRVEEQQNLIDRLTRQARDRYIDLDQRILKLSEKVAEAPASSPEATDSDAEGNGSAVKTRIYRQPSDEERSAYQEIQTLIHQEKNYDQAINGLYDFIDEYEEGDLTVNAYYWLGEVYLVEDQLEQARQAFTIVATRYKDHRKAPDAVYKLGVTLDRLGNKDQARSRMETVIEDYPGTRAAELAQNYLDSGSS